MADFNSKYSGEQVEALLDQVASGNAGGGGGGGTITEAEIAAMGFTKNEGTITEVKMNGVSKGTSGVVDLGDVPSKATVDDLVDVVNGINDDVAELTKNKENTISDLETIREGASKGATAVQPESLLDYALEGYVDAEVKALGDSLAEVASSGSYSDLSDKPTFKTINNESIVGSGNITISGGSGEQGEKGDKGDKGDTGVGVQSVVQTTTSNADGGSNIVTVTLTNGATSNFTVKNGSKGSQGIQGEQGPKGDKGDTGANGTNGTNGKDGADGDDGATFTPSVDSAGNLSWTNNKGLTNPPTVNIKGPKGDKGDAGEGGGGASGGGGVETISLYGGFGAPLIIDEMLAEKRYWLYVEGDMDGNDQSIVIGGFEGDGVEDGTYIRHFYAVIDCVSSDENQFNVSLSLPDVEIRWSTGVPIPIGGGVNAGRYELSITQVIESGYAYYNAVLTSFS